MIFSSLYDVHTVFCYISDSEFQSICVSLKKAIKNTGFINTTPSDIVYRATIRYTPFNFCVKAIITLGLRHVHDVSFNPRTLKIREHYQNKSTFRGTFIKLWNEHIPHSLKNTLVNVRNNNNSIKSILKNYFRLPKLEKSERSKYVWSRQ